MPIGLQREPWWPMHPWADTWAWWTMLLMMLLWLVIIVAVVWILFRIAKAQGWVGTRGASGNGAESILRERYARGEIDGETLRRMLDELRRSGRGGGPP